MNRFVVVIFSAGLAGLVVSCTYVIDQKYFNPIQPPPNTITLSVSVNDPNFQDPYHLIQTTQFNFTVGDITKPILGIQVVLDGSVIANPTSNPIQFTLNPAILTNGMHAVEIVITLDSNSGSLINHLGGEHYVVKKDFKVIVDNTLPQLSAPKIAIEKGYLTLRWDSTPNHDFNFKILVYKQSQGSSLIKQKMLLNPRQPIFVDSGYVGGHNSYYLYVSNFAGEQFVGTADINVSPAKFTSHIDANRATSISWIPLFQNANFTLVGNSGSRTIPFETGTISCDSLYLGDMKTYHLFVQRHGYPLQAYDSLFILKTEPNIPSFSNLAVLPIQSKVLLMNPYNIERLGLPDFSKEDSLSRYIPNFGPISQFASSADGLQSTHAIGNLALDLFNSLDFSNRRFYRPEIYDPIQGWILTNMRSLSTLSNNGLLGMSLLYNGSPMAAIADITINTDIDPFNDFVWKDSTNANLPVIAEDGRYFSISSADGSTGLVYANVAGSWNLKGKVDAGQLFFRGHSTTELISIGTSVKIYDVASVADGNGFLHPVRTFNYASSFAGSNIVQVAYDRPSGMIYVETMDPAYYSTISIFDTDTFTLNEIAKAYVPPAVPFASRHIYSNHYHFLSTGFAEKVK